MTTESATLTGDELRTARQAAGLTQRELAAAVGVTVSAVSAWEREQAEPQGCTADWIVAALEN